jgi:hypothetical protein
MVGHCLPDTAKMRQFLDKLFEYIAAACSSDEVSRRRYHSYGTLKLIDFIHWKLKAVLIKIELN